MVSIIVPIYAVEQYLEKCIDSLLAQTYKDIEIILVDDGSPDRCGEICDRYAAADKRVVVIHQQNQGVSAARNAGIDAAKGEYVAFVDSDDWVHADYLECLIENIGTAALCTNMFQIVNEGAEIPEQSLPCTVQSYTCEQALSREDCRIYSWGKLFRRSFIADTRFNRQLSHSEDRALIAELFAKHPDEECIVISQKHYYYLQHEASVSNSSSFSDLPSIKAMISIAESTHCAALLEYMIAWLCAKRRSGSHIGMPPDFTTLDQYLQYCASLIDHIIPQKSHRIKNKAMIRMPRAYRWYTRAKRIMAKLKKSVINKQNLP